MRALALLYSCTWCLSPPRRNDAPSMNSVLVTIAPAMDAFTSMYCPARRAASAMTSSVRFPSVALSRPPTASPVLAATDSVAWLRSVARGTMASTDSTKSSVCASGLSLLGGEHDGHEGQQPEHRIVTDLLEQLFHGFTSVRLDVIAAGIKRLTLGWA